MRSAFRVLLGLVLFAAIVARPLSGLAQSSVRDAAKVLLGTGFSETDIDAVANVLALQIVTFPVGTSSGAFTLIPSEDNTGAVGLKKDSFGPLFAERASTLGIEGALKVGVTFRARGSCRSRDAACAMVTSPPRSVDTRRFPYEHLRMEIGESMAPRHPVVDVAE